MYQLFAKSVIFLAALPAAFALPASSGMATFEARGVLGEGSGSSRYAASDLSISSRPEEALASGRDTARM